MQRLAISRSLVAQVNILCHHK